MTHRYRTPGTYTATVTVTDVLGATGTATVNVIVRGGADRLVVPSSVRAFRADGLRLRLACESSGDGRATLKVTRRVAKRLGLENRTVAARRLSCTAGEEVSLRLKPSRSTARRLARSNMRTLRLTLNVSVEGRQVLQRKVTIR